MQLNNYSRCCQVHRNGSLHSAGAGRGAPLDPSGADDSDLTRPTLRAACEVQRRRARQQRRAIPADLTSQQISSLRQEAKEFRNQDADTGA